MFIYLTWVSFCAYMKSTSVSLKLSVFMFISVSLNSTSLETFSETADSCPKRATEHISIPEQILNIEIVRFCETRLCIQVTRLRKVEGFEYISNFY